MNVDDTPQNGPDEPRPDDEPTVEQPRTDGPQAPPPAAAGASQPRRLLRSRDNRVIGGVAGGLGKYFNVDPIFFRIGAIALAFLGGAGVLLYLAALLLVPSEQGDGAAAGASAGEGRNRALVIAGVVVLLLVAWPFLLGGGLLFAGLLFPLAVLVGAGVVVWWLVSGEGPSGEPKDIARRAALGTGVLILCCIIAFGGAIAVAAGPDWIVAALVIAAGLAIAAGAFLKPLRWLVLPAVTLALAAGTVSAAGIDLDGGVGERDYRPASALDIKDRYQLGMGELVVDLRETDLPSGDVPIEVDLGVGEARVLVPEDVCVATTADVGVGNVNVFGRDNGGIDVDLDERPDPGDATRVIVDAEIGLGELRVDDDIFRDGDGFAFDETGGNDACASTGQSASG